MRVINFSKGKVKNNIVLALGNFDGVHIGHRKILLGAVKYAKKNKTRCRFVEFGKNNIFCFPIFSYPQ